MPGLGFPPLPPPRLLHSLLSFFTLLGDWTSHMLDVSVTSCCCDKMPGRWSWRKGGPVPAHSFRVQSVTVRRAWRQELEAAGEASTVRKERNMVLSSLAPSHPVWVPIPWGWSPARGTVPFTLWGVFPLQLTQYRPPVNLPRSLSPR